MVAIGLKRFVEAVVVIGVVGVATWIDGPHVPLGLTFDDPLGQRFACTTALDDAKGERMRFKRVLHIWHWPNH